MFASCGPWLAAHFSSWPILVLTLAWLFFTILGASLSVVRHAERLAGMLGEPYGTLILTLSVTVIEVASISSVMLHGESNPTLARDTLFAVVMIILNGMVGLSLLIGGLRHGEQEHNLQGTNAYLSVAIPLIVMSLVLPTFTQTTSGPTLSAAQEMFLVVVSVGLYSTFLAMQTGRHRSYFGVPGDPAHAADTRVRGKSTVVAAALLLAHMAPAVYLAERMSEPLDFLIETLHAPVAFGGVVPRGSGGHTRGARRCPCGNGEPPAALGQHLPGLGAVDDRADRPGDDSGQPCHRAAPCPRHRARGSGDAAADAGR